jgi:hypothetical protein
MCQRAVHNRIYLALPKWVFAFSDGVNPMAPNPLVYRDEKTVFQDRTESPLWQRPWPQATRSTNHGRLA